jgi:hypothetical protein
MTQELVEEFMVFAGLMATLGSLTKIILSIIHRKRALPDSANAALTEIAQRLSRLEQAVDATAVEVERISEAQRFTTKLLVEKGKSGQELPRSKVITPH